MAEELLALKGDIHIPTKTLYKRIFTYIKPYWKSFVLAFVLLIINVATDLIIPLFTSYLTDYLNGGVFNKGVSIIIWCAVGQFAISVVGQFILYFESILLNKVGQNIIYNIRMEVFTHIENMSQNQFNEMPVGSLVTRVANYTASMSELFTSTLVNMLRNILTVIGVYIIMIILNPLLSAILLIFVFLVAFISFYFRHIVAKYFQEERGTLSDLNTFLNENLGGMKITQLFNQEARKLNEFDDKNAAYHKAKIKVMAAFSIYRPTISLIYFLAVATTFYFGIQDWIALSTGGVVAFYLYLSRFFNPIQNLADQLNSIQKARTASERLLNLLDVKPQVLDKEDAKEIDHFEGKIEFKHVWFAYEKENWILKDVSFVIEPKTTVAFVGATGSGKTTILSLIVRNYEVQKGEILIDDINVKDIKITSLRKAIGQMLQDVFLFSGSIRDNITLHDEEYSDEEIKTACTYVNADKFINKLPNKLDQEVIERGENFSQGQRQLLSFARTVLAKPQILILDEATANIDTETEVLIQESLEKMKSIGTMLVVAHRLSTIQKSDQIFMLQNGEIIERGNHQSLLKQKGQYYKLYQLQFEQE